MTAIQISLLGVFVTFLGLMGKFCAWCHARKKERLLAGSVLQVSDPVGDFAGREHQLNAAMAAFQRTRRESAPFMLGLHGMCGVGKTEIAKMLASRLKRRLPSQVYYDLRGARDDEGSKPATPFEVLQHVVQSFQPEAKVPDNIDQLRGLCYSCLAGKHVLLLMDNALDSDQFSPLAPPPRTCALVVTSRNHLVVPGMQTLDVEIMQPQEARTMLLQICPRIGEKADELAETCDRLPLALRLAGTTLNRNPRLAVEDYVQRLTGEQQRLSQLDEERRLTGVERGIQGSFAASYRLLNEPLQRLWRELSVFCGDFDKAAGAAIWQETQDVCEHAFSALYNASMILAQGTGRYRLHGLGRDFALGCLPESESASASQRHAQHYEKVLRYADELYERGGDDLLQGLELFDLEWHNVQAGQAWAASHWQEDDAIARLVNEYPRAGAYCLNLRLHPRELIAWREVALAAARKLNDQEAEQRHLGNLGNAYTGLGEARTAIEYQQQALELARKMRDCVREAAALNNLGLAFQSLGETSQAITYYHQALELSRKVHYGRCETNAVGNLGNCYSTLEPQKAIDCYQEALDVARRLGDHSSEALWLHNMADTYQQTGRYLKARSCAKKAARIAKKINSPLHSVARP